MFFQQRFLSNLVGGFGSGLDGLNTPSIEPAFGVTFGTLPNTVQTPFGGGYGGGYGNNNPLGLDIGPVSLNPFVGFRVQKGTDGKVFVPSLDILVSPSVKGTNAIKKLKHRVRDAHYDDGYHHGHAVPIETLPYHPEPYPPYHHQPIPTYPPHYEQYPHPPPYQGHTYPVHHEVPQVVHSPPVHAQQHGLHHAPHIQQHHPAPSPVVSYPPTGPYSQDNPYVLPVHAPPHQHVVADNPYETKKEQDVKLHHHIHEHTHIHKGLNGVGSFGSFREDSHDDRPLTTIEHLGRQFRGKVKTKPQVAGTQGHFKIPSSSKHNTQRFTFQNSKPNYPSNTFKIKSNSNVQQRGFKFPKS